MARLVRIRRRGVNAIMSCREVWQDKFECAGCVAEVKIPHIFASPLLGDFCPHCSSFVVVLDWICDGCGARSCMQMVVRNGNHLCKTCEAASIRYAAYQQAKQTAQYNNPFARHSAGGPTMPQNQGNVRIWWDEQVQAYRMTTPFNAGFVDLLKTQIPHSDRSWDKPTKIWTFSEKWLDPVKLLCSKAFGNVTIITKADAQKAQIPPATSSATLPSMFQQFFELVPYDALRKAYLLGISQLHPDRGGDATKASQLNAVWQRLEKEFFKK